MRHYTTASSKKARTFSRMLQNRGAKILVWPLRLGVNGVLLQFECGLSNACVKPSDIKAGVVLNAHATNVRVNDLCLRMVEVSHLATVVRNASESVSKVLEVFAC